ncbi:hypothetical protein VNO77_27501 [Canavalia gladiata]|uniref:Uncharacterized protein n=1 Tax=Canavalia gladiata TaxID=3824 RepID=A0AAN9KVX3_CANGL
MDALGVEDWKLNEPVADILITNRSSLLLLPLASFSDPIHLLEVLFITAGRGKEFDASKNQPHSRSLQRTLPNIKHNSGLAVNTESTTKFEHVVPHIMDAIKDWIESMTVIFVDGKEGPADVCVIEWGGTLVTLSLWHLLRLYVGEQKAKPIQHSVRKLRALGLTLHLLACRSYLNLLSQATLPNLNQWMKKAETYDNLTESVRMTVLGKKKRGRKEDSSWQSWVERIITEEEREKAKGGRNGAQKENSKGGKVDSKGWRFERKPP